MEKQESITAIEQYVIDYVLKLRASKKLTQQDIANIIGVSRPFINDVESSNRPAKYNLRHINALADYFNMSPRDFLPEKPFPVDAPVEKAIAPKAPARKAPAKKLPAAKPPVGKAPVKKASPKKAPVKKAAVKKAARKK